MGKSRQQKYDELKARQQEQLKAERQRIAEKRLRESRKAVEEAARAERLERQGVIRMTGKKWHRGEVPPPKRRSR